MSDLQFTLQDCDQILEKCLVLKNTENYTTDFEIIPRQKNYIFKITTTHNETIYLHAKPGSHPPKIDKILEDFQLEKSKLTPKFFTGKSNLLFFEDLTYQKFQTNLNLYELKHLRQVLNVLAEFHAAGVNYEEKKSKKLSEVYGLRDFNFDVEETEDLVWSLIDNTEEFEEIKGKLLERQKCGLFLKTLCHGNLKAGNCLFYYQNGSPQCSKLINFGTTLYAPPVYDVLQLIFFNTSQDFRKLHFENLLSYYYQQFDDHLSRYNLKKISFDDFKTSADFLLPLVKLEAVLCKQNQEPNKLKQELKESLRFLKISREDCYVIIQNFIKTTNFDLVDFHLQFEELENQFLLKIKIRQLSVDEILQFVVKASSSKNVFIYKKLLPQMQEFSINFLNDCLPICYYEKTENLVFEDLFLLDFRIVAEQYTLKMLSIIFKKLAQFHAASMIFEQKQSEKMKIAFRLSDHLKEDFCKIDYLQVISSFESENFDKLFKRTETNCRSFRKVLCTGISSKKKILLKIEDSNPINCKFVNLENAVYDFPASDFLTVLNFTSVSSSEETRRKCEEKMKKIYYDELEKSMAAHNYNIKKFISYEEFEESLEFVKPQVLLQSALLQIFEKHCSVPQNANEAKQVFEEMMKNANFRETIKVTIADFCKNLNN